MISNCGKDEKGSYSGGIAGDQTGKEYWLIGWYNRPWNCVLRHPDATVRAEIARLATAAAQNNNIGYDQKERLTFWEQLTKFNFEPARITVPCEADCSSSTAAVVKAAGYKLDNAKLKNVSPSLTTYNMRSNLLAAGFDLLTDAKYLNSDVYLLAGDVLLNDSMHAAVNVTNGKYADTNYGNTTVPQQPTNDHTPPENAESTVQDTSSPSTAENVSKGDLVALKENATYYSGASVPAWVKRLRWYIASVNGERAVLGKSEDGRYNITSPINVRYLIVVAGSTGNTSAAAPVKPDQSTDDYPIVCMMTQSTCYRRTSKMTVKGVLWHSTGANNPWLMRYVQPDDNASNKAELLAKLGKNSYGNDWNHVSVEAGLNAWIGKLADGTVATVQTMPWDYKPWGCGGGCNNGWIQFEICEDGLNDRSYFNAVYAEAVKLTAFLCKKYGIDPFGKVGNVPTILCHQDSYRYGMGSNHSDVYHWFNRFGKTMDDVRKDVAAALGITGGGNGSTLSWNGDLGKGDSGADVEKLQNALISLGYKLPKWGADGDFGSETDEAVRKFQTDNKLKVDGIAGQKTLAAIKEKLLK